MPRKFTIYGRYSMETGMASTFIPYEQYTRTTQTGAAWLKKIILHRQQQNESLILFIDANDHSPSSPFQRFKREVDLVDIIATDRDVPPTATHMSGNKIDYILLSPDLAAGTIALGILPLNYHVISDHRASYCDIDVQALFDIKKIEELTHGTRRKL